MHRLQTKKNIVEWGRAKLHKKHFQYFKYEALEYNNYFLLHFDTGLIKVGL